MLELYTNIKKYRQSLGMSQEELAKRAGYTDRSSIAKIEKGKVDLPQSKIKLFADIFGITPGELMGNDGVITLDLSEIRKAVDKVSEEMTPGLSSVMRMYSTFDQRDRDEVLALMNAKLRKYTNKPT